MLKFVPPPGFSVTEVIAAVLSQYPPPNWLKPLEAPALPPMPTQHPFWFVDCYEGITTSIWPNIRAFSGSHAVDRTFMPLMLAASSSAPSVVLKP